MAVHGDLKRTRAEIVADASIHRRFDVVIIGGGIHGASCARFAAGNGLSTLLLEKSDYGAGTSSRSSKMAHGGLRYLEMFDFEQVFEGIKAREEMFAAAPHIVSPTRFLIPVPKGERFFRLKLGIGLHLYDLMVSDKRRKHHYLKSTALEGTGFAEQRSGLSGCFSYTDGLLNDGLLTLENVMAARRSGAVCLNYAGVSGIEERTDGVEIRWRDELTGAAYSTEAAAVLNCAGPWAPFLVDRGERPAVRLSRGTHLIFNRPWHGPSLFLPMEGKARYYFVWPHPAGTMVGTTERETDSLELDPFPAVDEVDEILARLAKDLPHSGLDRESLHYCFAGVRTLPLRPNSKAGTARLSRKHIWHGSDRVLTLVGGKLTTAAWTAEEGVKKVFARVSRGGAFQSLRAARMPRADVPPLVLERFRMDARKAGLSEENAARLVRRFGPEVEFLRAENLRPFGPHAVEGEIELALDLEQAETIEDVLRRRLNLEYMPGHGLAELNALMALFQKKRPSYAFDVEAARYRERIGELRKIMRLNGEAPLNAALG